MKCRQQQSRISKPRLSSLPPRWRDAVWTLVTVIRQMSDYDRPGNASFRLRALSRRSVPPPADGPRWTVCASLVLPRITAEYHANQWRFIGADAGARAHRHTHPQNMNFLRAAVQKLWTTISLATNFIVFHLINRNSILLTLPLDKQNIIVHIIKYLIRACIYSCNEFSHSFSTHGIRLYFIWMPFSEKRFNQLTVMCRIKLWGVL